MLAIFKRETKSYFTGMIGYVVIGVMLAFIGLYYSANCIVHVGFFHRALFHHHCHAVCAAGAQHAQLCG